MKLSFPIYRLKRQAKLLAREKGIPLHLALDQIAHSQGFRAWSHLAESQSQVVSAKALLEACTPGELVLLATRPGHGKTLLALDLLAEAAGAGRAAYFFTLEYHPSELQTQIGKGIHIDTSDGICADYIIGVMQDAPAGSVAAIDYLQLLDQKRQFPPLADQVATLKRFAEARGITILALSQIDRGFDAKDGPLPGFADIRLPNPVDLSLISKACFLHDGQARLETLLN
ncbi:DNA helicase [Roseovarius sp. 2305UL8-3]|uniref:DNA helicase n=1 Tax=Roseovarius conchicola TaxID=3121636 RepID=UPI003528DDA8